jgi:hypothetical protein
MSGKPVKPPATKNRPAAVGFVTQAFVLKNGLKNICRKKYEKHLRSNNHELCTAVALCFQNILHIMVLQHVNLPDDKIG